MAQVNQVRTGSFQQGVVLIVSLIFMIALTAAGVALLSSSTLDIKMASATEDKVIATQSAYGASDEAISMQVTKLNASNNFALPLANYPVDVVVTDTEIDAQIETLLSQEADCPAQKLASSIQVFKCNILELEVKKEYGRFNNNEVEVRTGIAQQLLNVGG